MSSSDYPNSKHSVYLEKLCALDKERRLDALVWQEFSGSIRMLLNNPYVFQTYGITRAVKSTRLLEKPFLRRQAGYSASLGQR